MIMPASAISPSSATKPNGRLETSSAPVAPINAERRRDEDQSEAREALQLNHQQRQHDDRHHREHDDERGVRLDAFLDGAAGLDAVAHRKRRLDRLQLRQHRIGDIGRLHVVDDVAADGQHDVAVAPPQDRLLELIVQPRDLRQRHGDAVSRLDGERRQAAELEPFRGDGAGDHVDMLDALAILRDHVAREQRLQRLRHVLRRQAEGTGAVLIDFEADRLDLLRPS